MANPYIDIQNLTKSFGAQVLFENISFSIAEGQRVGLIAQNGTGKSTLLSILTGHEGYDSGDIIYRRDLKTGYLEQSPRFNPDESVLDACFNHEGNPDKVLRAKQILTQLKIRDLNTRIFYSNISQRFIHANHRALNITVICLFESSMSSPHIEVFLYYSIYIEKCQYVF